MPRRERLPKPKSMVAAAQNFTSSSAKKKAKRLRGEDWQSAAWDFFDSVPEYHQGCVISGALLSRAKLYVAERDEEGTWNPTTDPVAKAALEDLYGGEEGQVEMLRQLGIHLSVAGEGWIVGPSDAEDADDWLVASPTELTSSHNDGYRIDDHDVPAGSLVLRVFKRHPRRPNKADAPTRSVLPVLSELSQLTKRIAAQIDSRLAGAGILLLPSETSFPASASRTQNPGDPAVTTDAVTGDAQGLADLLFEVAQEAVADPESAAAMMPIIAEAPGEYIGNARHLNFWSELDKGAPALRDELIRRIALGLDIPPEVLLGNAGSNHWNAWLSDENSVKVHAEPLLKLITSSLTTGYLRPALEDEVDDPKRFAILADTSQMRLRPNRSKEALELHDRLLLSPEAALRENGFTDSDVMADSEIVRALIRKVASGSTTPELVEAALRKAGVQLDVQVQDTRPPAEARPTPSLLEHPVRELPQEPDRDAAHVEAVTFAAEQIVDRALQRAGNRLKTKLGLKQVTAPANRLYSTVALAPNHLDDLLLDAWGACAEFDLGVDSTRLESALDAYTRSVMVAGQPPTRAGVRAAVKSAMGA